jgi:hypothetical protein
MTELAALQDRVEELEMALGQSEDLLISLAARFGLHGYQARIVAALLQRAGMTHAGIYAVLYGTLPAGSQPASLKAIKAHIHFCRKKLTPCGITIGTIHGLGYRLTPDNKQKIRQLLQREAA